MFPEALKEDLYHCLKCGMCQPFCPTFKATRQEYFTPRGRVQLIKHYLEGDLKATPVLQNILTSCILCDACAAMCPSGVQIDRLFRNMRIELARGMGIGIKKRLLFASLQGNFSRAARCWDTWDRKY
jgi:glycolate oxidase iron-sulfur subunit